MKLTTNNGISPKLVRELNIHEPKKFDYYYVGNLLVRNERPQSRSRSGSREHQPGSFLNASPDRRLRIHDFKRPASSQPRKIGNLSMDQGQMMTEPATIKKGRNEDVSVLLGTKKKSMSSHLDDPFVYANFKNNSNSNTPGHEVRRSRQGSLGGSERKEVINKTYLPVKNE